MKNKVLHRTLITIKVVDLLKNNAAFKCVSKITSLRNLIRICHLSNIFSFIFKFWNLNWRKDGNKKLRIDQNFLFNVGNKRCFD